MRPIILLHYCNRALTSTFEEVQWNSLGSSVHFPLKQHWKGCESIHRSPNIACFAFHSVVPLISWRHFLKTSDLVVGPAFPLALLNSGYKHSENSWVPLRKGVTNQIQTECYYKRHISTVPVG